jgi:transcriptional regulator with XRE-family HTH domain
MSWTVSVVIRTALKGVSDVSEDMAATYARRVGDRLRGVRRQQQLSLHGVEAASGQEFKASVLGAYERGERAISVPRLQRLAKFYNIPVDQLLPRGGPAALDWRTSEQGDDDYESGKVTLDLLRLEASAIAEKDLLLRCVNALQLQRQDFNGRVITMRGDDVRLIASMVGLSSVQLRQRLVEVGVVH